MSVDSPNAWRDVLRRRVFAAASVFALWGAVIEARLVYLQIVERSDLTARAQSQQQRTIPAPAQRGEIVDRTGRVLAYSVDGDAIVAVPSDLGDLPAAARRLCDALTECEDREQQAILRRLRQQKSFAYVRRRASPQDVARVGGLGMDGVAFIKESRRYYPNRELAAHVVGYVGVDAKGLAGIESTYDARIRGVDGAILVQTDARRRAFSRVERPPTSGASFELTIDHALQFLAERELHAGVLQNRAAGGAVVIMDPNTGEILAMASNPTFNPNDFNGAADGSRRNRTVQDLFEPGSTFKMVTASGAIEEHVIGPNDYLDVSAGLIRIGSRVVHDFHRYGPLTFTDVIVKSSNVGAILVGWRLGAERFLRYMQRFGFGGPISPDFPGENPGIVWDLAHLNDSALASVSMGYQVGVTPLQMAAAASAIANGGELIEPRVVRAVYDKDGRKSVPRRVIRRVVSQATTAELTAIMEGVTVSGTAKAAAVPGFTVAAKTGTAAKLVAGRYSKSEYNASIVGFAPSRRPAAVVIVVIDSPHNGGYTGGAVAAPIFQRIMEATLRRLGESPTLEYGPRVLVARSTPPAAEGHITTVTTAVGPALVERAITPGSAPDVIGLSMREAVRLLHRAGATARVRGVGVVAAQSPAPGSPVEDGAQFDLTLDRGVAPGGGGVQ